MSDIYSVHRVCYRLDRLDKVCHVKFWPVSAGQSIMEMEVDCLDSSPQVLVESAPGSPDKSTKERMLDLLDKMELRVERLRREAFRLEEEKDKVLTTLVTLRNSDILQNLCQGKECPLKYLRLINPGTCLFCLSFYNR